MTKKAKTVKMFNKTLFLATCGLVAAAILPNLSSAKYYNVVSWAYNSHHQQKKDLHSCEETGFSGACLEKVKKPAIDWILQTTGHVEIFKISENELIPRDRYDFSCRCSTTIYYSTDNITYVQGTYGAPIGSVNAGEVQTTSNSDRIIPVITLLMIVMTMVL